MEESRMRHKLGCLAVNYSLGCFLFLFFPTKGFKAQLYMFRGILLNLWEIPECSIIRSQQDIIKDTTYI